MVFAAATLLAAHTQAREPDFFAQLQIPYSGRNGREEYLMAAQKASTVEFRGFYEQANALMVAIFNPSADKPSPSAYRPFGLSESMTIPEIGRLEADRLAPITELIERGNSKPALALRTVWDGSTLFPELSAYRTISKVAADTINFELSQGNSSRAAKTFLTYTTFAGRFVESTLIELLVSVAMQAVLTGRMPDQIYQFGYQDLQTIRASTANWLQDETLLRCMTSDWKYSAQAIEDLLKDPAKLRQALLENYAGSDDDSSLGRYLKTRSLEQIAAVMRQVAGELRRQIDASNKILKDPESTWIDQFKANAPVTPDKEVDSDEKLSAYMLAAVGGSHQQVISAVVLRRTQSRILRLYCRVLEYRWAHGHLPAQLSDCAPDSEIKDPLSGSQFVYQTVTDLVFEVYSAGRDVTGKVGLRYTRMPTSATDAQNP